MGGCGINKCRGRVPPRWAPPEEPYNAGRSATLASNGGRGGSLPLRSLQPTSSAPKIFQLSSFHLLLFFYELTFASAFDKFLAIPRGRILKPGGRKMSLRGLQQRRCSIYPFPPWEVRRLCAMKCRGAQRSAARPVYYLKCTAVICCTI